MPDKSGGKRRPEMLPPMRIYNLEEELRRCAFEIYVDCGPEGHDLDDWLFAQVEALGTHVRIAARRKARGLSRALSRAALSISKRRVGGHIGALSHCKIGRAVLER
jgi:hypothetical protein